MGTCKSYYFAVTLVYILSPFLALGSSFQLKLGDNNTTLRETKAEENICNHSLQPKHYSVADMKFVLLQDNL